MSTIGVYQLVFQGLEDWPYVGISLNIEGRFRAHINALKAGKSNKFLLEAYKMCGEPTYIILEECLAEELYEKEIKWIKQLNSIEQGLNITSGGDSSGAGTMHARSKYTKEQIITVFKMLLNPYNQMTYISDKTGVSYAQVSTISRGTTHLWLKEDFPEEWDFLHSFAGKRNNKALGIIKLVSPQGSIIEVSNVEQFAKQQNSRVCEWTPLLNGERKQHKGWTLLGEPIKIWVIRSPEGKEFIIKEGNISTFADTQECMTRQGLHNYLKRKRGTYKGWAIVSEKVVTM